LGKAMSDGWSDTDKRAAQKIATRAKACAESEVLKLFHETQIESVDDLWALELKIREWRRDRQHVFNLVYARAEEQIAEWMKKRWLSERDIAILSPARRKRIASGPTFTTGTRE